MTNNGDAERLDTRVSVLSAINDLGAEGSDPTNRALIALLENYSALQPQSTVGEEGLLAASQCVSVRTQRSMEEQRGVYQGMSSGRYSQVYQLSATPTTHRRKMVVTNLSSKTTKKTLVEYFVRYGRVTDVKMNDAKDGRDPASAVLEFFSPMSVQNAVQLQHVVDGKIVTCSPFQADRVVEAIPWTSSTDGR